MDLRALADLGKQMREAQKRYFATRSTEALDASKRLERAFDQAVAQALDPQPGLFDRAGTQEGRDE